MKIYVELREGRRLLTTVANKREANNYLAYVDERVQYNDPAGYEGMNLVLVADDGTEYEAQEGVFTKG
jgi:hypothetical protein